MKNPYRDRDEIQDLIFLRTKTETKSRIEVFTDQNQDEIKINHRSSGRVRKQEKGKG